MTKLPTNGFNPDVLLPHHSYLQLLSCTADKVRDSLKRVHYNLMCSVKYRQLWQELLQKIGSCYTLTLAQYIGDHILDALVKRSTPVEEEGNGDSDGSETINELELKALRYAAWYIPRNLKKLRKSADPLRRQLEICLWELLEVEDVGGTADEWIKTGNCGSLTWVNKMTFQVLLATEQRIRVHLKVEWCCLNLDHICDMIRTMDVICIFKLLLILYYLAELL